SNRIMLEFRQFYNTFKDYGRHIAGPRAIHLLCEEANALYSTPRPRAGPPGLPRKSRLATTTTGPSSPGHSLTLGSGRHSKTHGRHGQGRFPHHDKFKRRSSVLQSRSRTTVRVLVR